jgi:hypothetical protein
MNGQTAVHCAGTTTGFAFLLPPDILIFATGADRARQHACGFEGSGDVALFVERDE